MRIMLLISQDHWTYTMRWGHNRLCGRVCSVAHWYRKLSFYHATHFPIDTEIQHQYVQDCIPWRSFRIDCDPVSETWWWSAEEDPEVFQLVLNAQKDTMLCISILHIQNKSRFVSQMIPNTLILCRTLTAVENRWVSMSILTSATCTMSAQARAG